MKITDCLACEFHVEHVSDSVLCSYNAEIEHRVISGTDVVACPLNIKKKGFLGLLKKS